MRFKIEFWEEVWISGGDYAVCRKKARISVVRMQPVPLPGVVRENDIWSKSANPCRDLYALP